MSKKNPKGIRTEVISRLNVTVRSSRDGKKWHNLHLQWPATLPPDVIPSIEDAARITLQNLHVGEVEDAEWADRICSRISDPILRSAVASIVWWNFLVFTEPYGRVWSLAMTNRFACHVTDEELINGLERVEYPEARSRVIKGRAQLAFRQVGRIVDAGVKQKKPKITFKK